MAENLPFSLQQLQLWCTTQAGGSHMERGGNAARPTELAQEFSAPLNINIEAQLLSQGHVCTYSTCAWIKTRSRAGTHMQYGRIKSRLMLAFPYNWWLGWRNTAEGTNDKFTKWGRNLRSTHMHVWIRWVAAHACIYNVKSDKSERNAYAQTIRILLPFFLPPPPSLSLTHTNKHASRKHWWKRKFLQNSFNEPVMVAMRMRFAHPPTYAESQ